MKSEGINKLATSALDSSTIFFIMGNFYSNGYV